MGFDPGVTPKIGWTASDDRYSDGHTDTGTAAGALTQRVTEDTYVTIVPRPLHTDLWRDYPEQSQHRGDVL
jgi:hypothetical protein